MYYVALVFAALTYYVPGIHPGIVAPAEEWNPEWYEVLMPLVFVQNVESLVRGVGFDYLPLFEHSWSVAIEEQFYLLWPLAMLLIRRRTSTTFFVCLGGLCILTSLILKASGWSYLLLVCRLEGFAMGAALAGLEIMTARGRITQRRMGLIFAWAWLVPALLSVPACLVAYGYEGPGFTKLWMKSVFEPVFVFSLMGFCVLGHCLFSGESQRSPLKQLLNQRALRGLGTMSYSLYLVHVPVVFALAPYLVDEFGLPLWTRYPLGLAASIGIAYATFRGIEWPILQWRRRFTYAHDER